MKYLCIGIIWIAYAGVVAAVAFGTHNADNTLITAVLGGTLALLSTLAIT